MHKYFLSFASQTTPAFRIPQARLLRKLHLRSAVSKTRTSCIPQARLLRKLSAASQLLPAGYVRPAHIRKNKCYQLQINLRWFIYSCMHDVACQKLKYKNGL